MREGASDAAMGLRVLSLELLNCGTRPYTVNGYPFLRVLDEDRAPLDVDVSHGASSIATIEGFDPPAAPVTLQPGEMAVAGLTWRNTVTEVKPAANGSYLDILPSGRESADDAEQTLPVVLDLGTTGKLGVSAWTRAPKDTPGQDRPEPGSSPSK